jgi:hypothetical protein
MGVTKKISAFFVIALMFVATTNIVLSAHICSGGFYNMTLQQEATSCCHNPNPDGKAPEYPGRHAISDGNHCCFTRTIDTTGVDIAYPSIGIREIDYQAAVFQLEIFDISLHSSDIQKTALKPYIPLLPDRDIPVLVQSFLL